MLINLIATSFVEKQNTATMALKDPKIAVLGLANNFIKKDCSFITKFYMSLATLICKFTVFKDNLEVLTFLSNNTDQSHLQLFLLQHHKLAVTGVVKKIYSFSIFIISVLGK